MYDERCADTVRAQHTSATLISTCTVGFLRAYFANGTLPPEGTICQVDESPFAPTGDNYTDVSDAESMADSVASASSSALPSSSSAAADKHTAKLFAVTRKNFQRLFQNGKVLIH